MHQFYFPQPLLTPSKFTHKQLLLLYIIALNIQQTIANEGSLIATQELH